MRRWWPQWRERLRRHGVWANEPVPLYPYPSSPDYRRLWGEPDAQAWERAHEWYLAQFHAFSDIQDQRPAALCGTRSRVLPWMSGSHGLRVLLTTDAVGGVWTYSLDLARELGRNGIETVLAVLGPPPGDAARAAALDIAAPRTGDDRAAAGLDGRDTGDGAGRRRAPGASWRASKRCALVQLHTPALAAARSFDVPVIAVHHSCLATWWRAVKGEEAEMPEDFRWRSAMVARGIAAVSQLVAPTTAHAHAIAAAYALSSPPLVIRNGRAAGPPRGDVGR